MMRVLAVAAGGAIGSALRFWVSSAVQSAMGRGFPYGTLAVNVAGCLAAGFLFVTLMERLAADSIWRAGIMVGVLGGFTTFSAFSVETFGLIQQGAPVKSLAYVVLSVVLCLTATWLGAVIGKQL